MFLPSATVRKQKMRLQSKLYSTFVEERLSCFLLLLSLLQIGCGDDSTSRAFVEEVEPLSFPDHFPDPKVTVSPRKVELGAKLFEDPSLSSSGELSCSGCHPQATSYGAGNLVQRSETISRNVQPLINLAWGRSYYWDGSEETLADQAEEPLINEYQMNNTLENIVSTVLSSDQYPQMFLEAFGDNEVTAARITEAIAQYESTLISGASKYDDYLNGLVELSEKEEVGREVFFSEKAECFHCHGTVLLTDHKFHDIGLDLEPSDLGYGATTEKNYDNGKFKTPTLRNVELTSPYMHDGRFKTLEEVVEHYNSGVKKSPNLDPLMQNARQLNLTDEEKEGLVLFLKTFTDTSFITKGDAP